MNDVRLNLYRLDWCECHTLADCAAVPIHARTSAVQALVQQLNEPLAHGESASCLLVGSPAQGKSIVLRRALQQVRMTHGGDRVRVVELHGNVHTDERSAVDAICKQLDVVIEERLAHRTLARKLEAVAEHLAARRELAVVFVLHEYDRFAERSQQTLLYNLYDLAQRGIRAAVLGVTARFDCLERLEKRVRSRSALRQIVLPDYTADDVLCILRAWLTHTADAAWNAAADAALADARCADVLQRLLESTRDLRLYQQVVLAALGVMHERRGTSLLGSDFSTAVVQHVLRDEIDATIDSLSSLEKAVLRILTYIASRHENSLLPAQFTFRAFLGHYREIVLKHAEWSTVRFDEPPVLAAFERLLDSSLLISTDSQAKTRAVPLEKLHVQMTVRADELELYFTDPTRDCPTFLTRPGSFYA
jgi:Cdc6-like AAA superfamily ATPase